MSNLPEIDTPFLLDFLTKLLNTASPTGNAEAAVAFTEETLKAFPALALARTRKGALTATWRGEQDEGPRAVTAHVDTLGAMVKEVKPNGRLKLSKIGGFAWNTIEGEGCTVTTRSRRQVRGSILLTKASSHVFGGEVGEMKRSEETLEVRLEARTMSARETLELGIGVGDFVAFDPRVEVNAGFVRSRHLDDKACVAALVAAVKALSEAGLQTRPDDDPADQQLRRGGARRSDRHPRGRGRTAGGGHGSGGRGAELGRVPRLAVREGQRRAVPSRHVEPAAGAGREERDPLQGGRLPSLPLGRRSLVERGRGHGGGADRPRGGCLAQLRADPHRSAGGDGQVGDGVFAGKVN